MSSGYWQTIKRKEQLMSGSSTTKRVEEYINKWQDRCYKNDIPDELPRKLMESGRAPSYRAIAEAILRNDIMLHSIGGSARESKYAAILYAEKKNSESSQQCLI